MSAGFDALGALTQSQWRALRAAAWRGLEPEDAVQEALLRTAKYWDEARGEFLALARRNLRNEVWRQHRDAGRGILRSETREVSVLPDDVVKGDLELVRTLLARFRESLTDRERHTWDLVEVEGYSLREAARLCNVSHQRLHQALTSARKKHAVFVADCRKELRI